MNMLSSSFKRGFIFVVFCFGTSQFFYSCKSTRNSKTKVESLNLKERDKLTHVVLNEAKNYKGTKYKAGGIDKGGMDCSGLVQTAFKKIDISLPRVSKDQSAIGSEIELKNSQPGDLIYFATSGKAKGINHVGIITQVDKDNLIYFIHSTLKSGVTENNMAEGYYRNAFVKVMRVY